jgi:hypothetical protein
MYIAECPELGLSTSGRTVPHALGKLKAESEEYLAALGPDARSLLASLRRGAGRAQPRHGGVLIHRFTANLEDGED